MKYTNLRAFEKHLSSSSPKLFSPVYLIVSKETFDRKFGLEKTLAYILQGQKDPALCTRGLEGDSTSTATLLSELNSRSFLIERMAVVVHNAEKLKKETQQALDSYFSRPDPSTYLILVASSLASNTNFYKNVEKVGVVCDVAEEKPWQKEKTLAEWVGTVVAAANKRIPYETCQWIVKQIGLDQAMLEQELEKLFCYVGDKTEISYEDVSAVCSTASSENVWQLGEAIFRREPAAALKACQTILAAGTVLIVLLKQLRNQFQTEWQVCDILARGGTSRDVAAQFPYMKGAILDRHVQMAQNYGLQRFRAGLIAIDEADVQAKNSSADAELLAEMLIVRLTT